MTTLIIRLQMKPEKEERCLQIIDGIIEKMRTTEPDTRVYAFWRTKTPHEYLLVESYTNAKALEFHIGQHMAGQEEFMSCLSQSPQVETLGEFVTGYPDIGTLPLAR